MSMGKSHISDYNETVGKRRAYQKENDGTQAGDPVRGAKVIGDAQRIRKAASRHACDGFSRIGGRPIAHNR
jgi:hypothetical protein